MKIDFEVYFKWFKIKKRSFEPSDFYWILYVVLSPANNINNNIKPLSRFNGIESKRNEKKGLKKERNLISLNSLIWNKIILQKENLVNKNFKCMFYFKR